MSRTVLPRASIATSPLIAMEGIEKTYTLGPAEVTVLRGVSLSVREGEFVAIVGASGSGKSTLLHIAGALDTPDRGRVAFRDESLADMSRWHRHRVRNQSFGFVFQFYHLLPELSVLENVLLPAMVAQPWWMALVRARPHKEEALALLGEFGLDKRLAHRPSELSGGERQRVAIARALINRPALLLADEPTGNLDAKTGRDIMNVILRLHKQNNQGILLVTHDPHVASLADRVVELRDGKMAAA